MKKQLDEKQYDELKRLGYTYGPTIGDLIEFLDDSMVYRVANTPTKKWAVDNGYQQGWLVGLVFKGKEPDTKEIHKHESPELCDALGNAIKELLKGQLSKA